MPNRFYVQPGADLSPGLQGLSASINEFAKNKRIKEEKENTLRREDEEKARLKKVGQGAAAVFQTGDPAAIAEYSLENPEVAQNLTALSALRDTKTKDFYVDTLFQIIQNPEDIENIVTTRKGIAKAQGLEPKEQGKENLKEQYDKDPEGVIKKLEQEVAFLAPVKWKAYREATGVSDKKPSKVAEFEYFQDLKITNPDIADQFGIGAGFVKGEKDPTAASFNFDKYIGLLTTDPEQAKLFGDSIGIDRTTPYTDVAKLQSDLNNKLITPEDYEKQRDKILNPMMKTTAELTTAALRGDAEAKNVLEQMRKDTIGLSGDKSEAATQGKLNALYAAMDLDGRAQAILEGRETIDNIRNTFGVPIQEVVAAKVLAIEPDFNFNIPRTVLKSLSSSLVSQQKNRGAMGSFVQNINGQVDKVEAIMTKVVDRFGVRALDVPWRNLKVIAIGEGDERVLESFTKEISVEIYKLSMGSTASVAILPEAGRKEWEKIHDVNLSWPQMKKVMEGTRDMANIRLKSVNDEIKRTVEGLANVRKLDNPYLGGPDSPGAEFPKNPDEVTAINPDTKEEETWNIKTQERVR